MKHRPLQFLGEDSQIKLYMNQNLHHDLVKKKSFNIIIPLIEMYHRTQDY